MASHCPFAKKQSSSDETRNLSHITKPFVWTLTTKHEIESKLRNVLPDIQSRFKVKRIGLFGSYVTGEQTDESDIDLIVEFSERVGMDYFNLMVFLEDLFEKKIDLVTPGGLKPRIKQAVLDQAVYV